MYEYKTNFDKDLILIHTFLSEFSRPRREAGSSKLRPNPAGELRLMLHVVGHFMLDHPGVMQLSISRRPLAVLGDFKNVVRRSLMFKISEAGYIP